MPDCEDRPVRLRAIGRAFEWRSCEEGIAGTKHDPVVDIPAGAEPSP